MSDWLDAEGAALWSRVEALIAAGPDARPDVRARDALAVELFAWQRRRCQAIDRVARAFAGEGPIGDAERLPGVPADAFKTARIACFDAAQTVRTFLTSGTTREVRGEHHFADTSLYREAALASGGRHLLRGERYVFALLAESEGEAPHSSLSFMLARFAERWGRPGDDPWAVRGGALDVPRVREAVARAGREGAPVALLGATFAFVHLADALGPDGRLPLPPGSVVMPTGGFKSRSRELSPPELFALIETCFGVRRADIVQEYGMTELSSQAYEAHADGLSPGTYVAPPWLVVRAVDPVELSPLPHGERGILRLVDLANVGSCIALQTADFGVTSPDGFTVLGRDPSATPRGCARALDALLAPR